MFGWKRPVEDFCVGKGFIIINGISCGAGVLI